MSSYNRNENILQLDKAIEIGKEVYYCLKRAEEKLEKATDWGLIDMVAANFLVSSMKHKRIEEANMEIQKARENLRLLNKELDRTVLPDKLSVNVSQIAKTADIWMASRVMDIFFQDRINDSMEEIEKSRKQIRKVVQELKKYKQLEESCVAEVDAMPPCGDEQNP